MKRTTPTHGLPVAVRIVSVPDAMRAELLRGVYPRLFYPRLFYVSVSKE